MNIDEKFNDPDALREHILSLTEQYYELAHKQNGFEPGKSTVPASGRVYASQDMRSLVDASLDFWLTTGRFNDKFEKDLAKFVGCRYALTVNSGSSANLVAFASLTTKWMGERAINKGDEVIVAGVGFPTTLNPALIYGLLPVFVDVEVPTYNIDPELIEAAVTEKTRVIMLAHTLGNPFDVDKVLQIAEKYELWVIEDCCDALGSLYDGTPVGNFGDVGTFSFYPAHHITTGEGGAVVTNNSIIKRAGESVRDWGRDCYCQPGIDNTCNKRYSWKLGNLPYGYDHKYTYSSIGYNLKMTDMQASVGVSQLTHLPNFIEKRKHNFNLLLSGLYDVAKFFILPQATPKSDPSWFGFPITIRKDAPFNREELLIYLNDSGIGTRLVFGGNIVRQPYMKDQKFRVSGQLSNSDLITIGSFWIGVYPGINDDAVSFVIDKFKIFCSKY